MGLARVILPELENADCEFLSAALKSSNKELTVRWAVTALSMELGSKEAEEAGALTVKVLHRLKFDNKTLDRIVLFVRTIRNGFPGMEDEDIRIRCRRLVSFLGWENTDDFLNLCEAVNYGMAQTGKKNTFDFMPELIKQELDIIKENGDCISLKELAVNGKDLIECGIEAGTELGKKLNGLLEAVLKDPDMNTRDRLLEIVKGNV